MKHAISPDTGEYLGLIVLDTDYKLVPPEEIYCSLCASNAENELLCLALQSTHRAADGYVRVGIVKVRFDHIKTHPEGVPQEGVSSSLLKYLLASPLWAKDGVESTTRLV